MGETTKVTKRKTDKTKRSENTVEPNDKKKKVADDKPIFGPLPKFKHQRLWSRVMIIIGTVIYIWYFSTRTKVIPFATQREVIDQRGQTLMCDNEFEEDVLNYPECAPKQCGRYVSDKIVTATEADMLLTLAKKGIALGGSNGGASVLDLHSGALSYGTKFINVYSLAEAKEVFTRTDITVYKIVKEKIRHAISELFYIDPDALHLTHPTFFSKLTHAEPKTEHDEYWHIHVDKDTYESFHYTSLLYLTDYEVDFKGGRLIFTDGMPEKPNNVTVEPRLGRVAIFTSGAENTHFVERVLSGTRYAITISFTCDVQKSIDDPSLP